LETHRIDAARKAFGYIMTKRVSITLNEAQEEILQSYADAMGMPLAYAARMAMLQPLMDWKAKVMRPAIDPLNSVTAPSPLRQGVAANVGKTARALRS
jgi:hypothetical protein